MLPIIFPLSAAEPRTHVLDIALAATDNVTGSDTIELDRTNPFLLLDWHTVSSLETLTEELHKKCSAKLSLLRPHEVDLADDYIPSRLINDARNSGQLAGPFWVLPPGSALKVSVKNLGGANASTVTTVIKGIILKDRNFWRQHGVV